MKGQHENNFRGVDNIRASISVDVVGCEKEYASDPISAVEVPASTGMDEIAPRAQ